MRSRRPISSSVTTSGAVPGAVVNAASRLPPRLSDERGRGGPIAGAAGAGVPPVAEGGYLRAVLGAAGRPGQGIFVYLRHKGARLDVGGVERTWPGGPALP